MPTQPDPEVAKVLNDVLTAELTAINQYFVHARMCHNWGYHRLHGMIFKESIDEMKHAEQLIERLLYIGADPDVGQLGRINIGETIKEALELDLALENIALPRLVDGIKLLSDKGDDGSRLLLEEILKSEEDHVDWLEAQLELIEQMGEQNYLATQI